MKSASKVALGLALPMAAGIIWWFSSANSTSVYFPPLKTILISFRETWFFEHFRSDLVPSLVSFTGGFAIAIFAGITLGIVLGISGRLRDAFSPVMEFSRATPVAALVPIALVVLGPGTGMAIALIAFAATWPILISTIDGVRGVDSLQLEMAKVYGLSRRNQVIKVVLPAAMPQIFAGLRIALSIGLAAMVIANMFGSSTGVGHLIVNAQQSFNLPTMWAALFMIGILGALVNFIFLSVQFKVLAWHRGWRSTTEASR